MNIIFNSLQAQLVKYDVHTTRIMKFIHANFLITYYYFIINVVTDRRMDIRAVLLVDRCDDASWSDVCARSER